MFLTEYETIVVIRPDIGGDAIEALLDKLRDVVRVGEGKLIAITHWGRKKLAYEIKKHTRGVYVHIHYLAPRSLILEIERNLRISDAVLRFLTVQLAEKLRAEDRTEAEYQRPEYDLAEDDSESTEVDIFAAPEMSADMIPEDDFGDADPVRGIDGAAE